jgi:phosphoribosylanthranilate isomerase
MTILVKICGLTNLDDTLDAIELGADYLGFNFYPDSPRFIPPPKLALILDEIPDGIAKVGVFVNSNSQLVIEMGTQFNLDLLQFHGDESPEYCNQFGRPFIRALRPETETDLAVLEKYERDYVLIDANVQNSYGGSGVVSNWDLARQAKKYAPLFLAGGLTCENIDLAISSVQPYAVDVASGVESSPGKKDYHKMEEFIRKVKRNKLHIV